MKIFHTGRQCSTLFMVGFLVGIIYVNLMAGQYSGRSDLFSAYFLNQLQNMEVKTGEYLWYLLKARDTYKKADPVEALDVSFLQRELLGPVLGIGDPRTDDRIDFIGGIRGLSELERRADSDCEVAFAMYPTSIQELFEVADAGLLMPPKSTWFEPKLRSGLFIHEIEK